MSKLARSSPFEPVLAPYNGEIPEAFKVQFLHSPVDGYHVVLDGHLDVWYRPRWLFPLFWGLEQIGILVSETGEDIPVTLVVRAEFDQNGDPIQHWDRTFRFRVERHFNTILSYDDRVNEVGDFIGIGRVVYIIWKAQYHPPRRFSLDTKSCAFHVRGRFFWLPRLVWERLFGVLHCDQVAHDMKGNEFDLELSIRHPWFGEFFSYKGSFKARRKAKWVNSVEVGG